jgi:hypothetical protein
VALPRLPQAVLRPDRDRVHGTKISLRIWVLVIVEMCASKNGVSAREIERK